MKSLENAGAYHDSKISCCLIPSGSTEKGITPSEVAVLVVYAKFHISGRIRPLVYSELFSFFTPPHMGLPSPLSKCCTFPGYRCQRFAARGQGQNFCSASSVEQTAVNTSLSLSCDKGHALFMISWHD
jgi:hypothetical protein